MNTVFLIGYPGDMGGANTEAWHSLKIWRRLGWDVHLIPTWGVDRFWRDRLTALGCVTHETTPEKIASVKELAGSIVVGFCNDEFLKIVPTLKRLDCSLVWANCMTFLFDREKAVFAEAGPPDVFIFQSEFQRSELEPQLSPLGYSSEQGRLIRGAFDIDEWPLRPRPHAKGEPFVVGRMARPDTDKWSSNTWRIYEGIQYANKRALMLGMDDATHAKLGPPPPWADCLRPTAIPVRVYLETLHCLLPVNGGARENWPRAGLEAMATGVPVVAQNQWGWREMVEHGVTGFLGDCDEELAHWTATLAYDEDLRQSIIVAARRRLEESLANPKAIGTAWDEVFRSLNRAPDQRDAGVPISRERIAAP